MFVNVCGVVGIFLGKIIITSPLKESRTEPTSVKHNGLHITDIIIFSFLALMETIKRQMFDSVSDFCLIFKFLPLNSVSVSVILS